MESLRNLFHRQLRIPLADHAQTLEQYKDWEQEQGVQIGTENDDLSGLPGGVSSAYKKADQMSKARVVYESNISAEKPVDGDLLQHYLVSCVLFSFCSFVPVFLKSDHRHPFQSLSLSCSVCHFLQNLHRDEAE